VKSVVAWSDIAGAQLLARQLACDLSLTLGTSEVILALGPNGTARRRRFVSSPG
jgi:hypothetical protein